MSHLVFYDGSCGLCDHVVQFLLAHDKKGLFLFAPLQGKTALKVLNKLPPEYIGEDSLVLVENFQEANERFYVLGKGALRIMWLLGGGWKLLGWISFLPAFLYDWAYRLVARNRKHFFSKESCLLPSQNENSRFLP
ncbi:MAG: DUF393 domain-containing protein [Parachlamydiaceae bacterium]|nr:DUF393 domain-containing protein [Parachlamydiaceae bacterium]